MFNWKTTAAGAAAVLGVVVDLLGQFSTGTFDPTRLLTDWTGLVAGIGLLFAKDANVTGGTVKQPNK